MNILVACVIVLLVAGGGFALLCAALGFNEVRGADPAAAPRRAAQRQVATHYLAAGLALWAGAGFLLAVTVLIR
jgi:hypothetical protein